MPLNILFENGKTVDATQLNALVAAINELSANTSNLQSTIDNISKSKLLVLASKNVQQTLLTQGQENIINNWNVRINNGSLLQASSGIITTNQSGTYTIEAKTIISADTAISPRSKLFIAASGNPVGVSEDTTYQNASITIDNYRVSHYANATVQLNSGIPIILVAQVWGASTGRIFADINTTVKVWLEV